MSTSYSAHCIALSMLVVASLYGCAKDPTKALSVDSGERPIMDANTFPNRDLMMWHISDGIDAVSLRLNEENMTFAWGIDGCDFFSGDQGRIEKNAANSWTLLPKQGRSTFRWAIGASFGNQVAMLTATIDGELDSLDLRGKHHDSMFIQSWDPEGSCAICNGNGIPTGKENCTNAYLGE